MSRLDPSPVELLRDIISRIEALESGKGRMRSICIGDLILEQVESISSAPGPRTLRIRNKTTGLVQNIVV